MVFLVPLLYFAGAVGLSVLVSGCNKNKKLSSDDPTESGEFPKSALEISYPDGPKGDGYESIFSSLDLELRRSNGQPISLDSYFNANSPWSFHSIFQGGKQEEFAKKFVRHLATHDERPNDISIYDVLFENYHLYGEQWKQDWPRKFLQDNATGDPIRERLRIFGLPLLNPASSPALVARSKALLKSFAVYAKSKSATDSMGAAQFTLDYFLNPSEPPIFSNYLKITFSDLMGMEASKKSEVFGSAVEPGLPDAETVKKLFDFFTREEAILFIRECLRKDPVATLNIFETVPFPNWGSFAEINSDESDFFPNLPQNTSFKDRQKAIDDFLGKPLLTMERKITLEGEEAVKTTLKKYQWKENTEVFSIESEKPGPTTLIFAPHYHEANPRKMFHWIKDIPLKSGRLILIPEANRAMGLAKKDTDPMNGLFNEAFTQDRIDYLIVRKTEYLMGLVDGMVGVHDSIGGPFFISDLNSEKDKGEVDRQGPTPSPWVPPEVKAIGEIPLRTDVDSSKKMPSQVQWQIADSARRKLQELSGKTFNLQSEDIKDKHSFSADSATGYMNFHLKKPAMTFEGRKGLEHGQLHATALYSLLLAFGHQIDARFETALQNPNPKIEPDLYQGLVPTAAPVVPSSPSTP